MDMDKVPIIIGAIVTITGITFTCLGFKMGQSAIIGEMEQYGSVRIDGNTYVLEEVINNDK